MGNCLGGDGGEPPVPDPADDSAYNLPLGPPNPSNPVFYEYLVRVLLVCCDRQTAR
eukprot:SAG22_NODE_13665_length_398_cov_2.090301_1_plen_55_part_10